MESLIAENPWLTSSAPYLTAFFAGLFGGVHCLGMCGGVAGAFSFGLPERDRENAWRLAMRTASYNLGRLSTYVGLGLFVGWLGFAMGEALSDYQSWLWLRYLAGVMMVAMGLYLAGWWRGLLRLEQGGAWIWRRLQPVSRRFLPVQTNFRAYAFGLVWGFLPCGLVYTMLVWSLAAGGWLEAAGFMFAFGLGTLPTVAGAGWLAAAGIRVSGAVRTAAALFVIAFGVWTIVVAYTMAPNVGLGCLPPNV